jgi:Flp pilus assembly protein TadD
MPSLRLRLSSHPLLGLATAIVLSGCATMGGGIANSSGMGFYEQGNYTAAASEFQQAVMQNPSNPDYMANLAKSRMKLGDAQGAEQLFRQALTVSPSHQPSYHGLAEVMLTQGRGQEAAAMMTTWAATQPYVAESHVELAWLQRELGQPQEAAQSLQRALQVNPAHSTALAHLGQYYEEAGRPDQAVAMYQQSLRSDWNQPEVHSRIAAASQAAGASSPMAATAMARGVHPWEMPRQQTAFGPPLPGAQRAQMQMLQTQMAMSGQPMMPGAMASGGMMPGGWAPSGVAMSPMSTPTMMSSNYPMTAGMSPASSGSWQPSAGPMMSASPATAFSSFGTNDPAMAIPSNAVWSSETVTPGTPLIETAPGTTETAAQPTPDPKFSMAPGGTPANTVSWSPTEPGQPDLTVPTAADATPVVDAF